MRLVYAITGLIIFIIIIVSMFQHKPSTDLWLAGIFCTVAYYGETILDRMEKK